MPKIEQLQFRWRNRVLEAWLDVRCHSLLSWNIVVADGTPEDFRLRDKPFSTWDPGALPSSVPAVYKWCYRSGTNRRVHRVCLDDVFADIKAEVLRQAKEFLDSKSPEPDAE